MNLSFRLATPADRYCAEADWLFSFRDSKDAGLICRSRWRDVMRPEIQRILDGPGVQLVVLHNEDATPESKADIVGWLAFSRQQQRSVGPKVVVHTGRPLVLYVYVKSHWHGRGFARALFNHVGIDPFTDEFDYACRTKTLFHPTEGREPLIKRLVRGRWDPLLARKEPYGEGREDPRRDSQPARGAGADPR